MRIKRLEICGFKSFMERQVFQFDDRVTGVVGPNGCGKSNVVDSIRWVLGEQSARHLRGRAMEDVIFNGSESKAPLSMAEVTITFSNDTPELLPAQYKEFGEISVTRRLFRSGESEYLINRTPCRLLDVSELFLGTGVGTKGYSIIEQGRIGLIVSAKPEDRRRLIEEAAGITLYQSRRKAAERKLELTEQNLVRIHDVNRETEKRLDSLGRQARKAEKYKRIKAQIRDIELHAASVRFLELCAVGRADDAETARLKEENAALDAAIHQGEADLSRLESELAEAEGALKALDEKAHDADNAVRVGKANGEAYRREKSELCLRIQNGRIEIVEIQGSEKSVGAELEGLKAEVAGLSETTDDDRRMEEVKDSLAKTAGQEKAVQGGISHERAQLMNIAGRLASAKSNLENLVRQKGEGERRAAAAKEEAAALSERIARLEESRSAIQKKLEEANAARKGLDARRADEELALAKVRQELVESEVGLIGQREALADKRSRLNSLKEIQENYEGFGKGVRMVMGHRSTGILGLVSDVIRAPAAVEKAIEAALGDRLQTVIVENRETALSELARLKSMKGGRVTFLPRNLPEAGCSVPECAVPMPTSESLPGFLGLAADLAETDAPFAGIARHLLGSTAVVQDIQTALSFLALGRPESCVTLDGEILEPSGSVRGGAMEGAGVGVLHKKREIKELTAEVARLSEDLQAAQEHQKALSERAAAVESDLKGISQNLHSEDLAVVEQEKDLHKATEDLAQARARLEKIGRDMEESARAMNALEDRENALSGEIAQCEGDKGGHEARIEELNRTLSDLRIELERLTAERTELQVRTAAEGERRQGLARALTKAESSLTDLAERRRRLENTLAQGEIRQGELDALIAATDQKIEESAQKLEVLKAEQQAAAASCADRRAAVKESQEALRGRRTSLKELDDALSAAALRTQERALEIAHLREAVAERHNTDLMLAVHDYHWRPVPTETDRENLQAMRDQIDKMGEINLTAIEECAELEQRHAAMAAQEIDLEKSIHQLRKAIVRINKTSKDRFRQAFNAINEKFQQLFPRLFNGGSAGLVLTEAEDGESEPGIEIMAQPPGKKLQSVNLLSGGEKALTAISLIFAIFLIKPTPFCLLDEVDAPLDEANVTRYNELIREMSQVSQFILITHNKRTMQVADTLYGVTMQEPGISSLVSVRMSRMSEAANDNRSAIPRAAAVNDNRSSVPQPAAQNN